MFQWLKNAVQKDFTPINAQTTQVPPAEISASLQENLIYLRGVFGPSFDLMVRELPVNGNRAAFVLCEGMCDDLLLSQIAVTPILHATNIPKEPDEQFLYLRDHVLSGTDHKEAFDMADVLNLMMSGFAALFIDGVTRCEVFGVQGFERRSISDPETEVQERGSRDGFVETLKVNTTLIRRRLKTPYARFEMLNMGDTSQTMVCLCYLSDRVNPDILEEVKQRLQNAKLDMVLESGYIQPFLDHKGLSFFSGVGVTERPDTLCAKISEGRVGVIVDGTPFALIVPHLFIENFQSIDDYSNRPFYALFLRALKFISFAISMLLPGIYVAVAIFHQELLPASMLFDIAVSEGRTPFPIMLEALVIHFIYEIMREAGLRMPKTVGHAVSIVGALVIGDAAVTAGLIAAPTLIVLALTAISSFVVPSLYEPAAVLRFLFIIVGGLTGLYGIMLILGLLILNACSINPYGVPYSAPITPFEKGAMRDLVLRVGWKRLGRYKMKVQDLNGSDKREPEDF